jgi:predicted membrane protein
LFFFTINHHTKSAIFRVISEFIIIDRHFIICSFIIWLFTIWLIDHYHLNWLWMKCAVSENHNHLKSWYLISHLNTEKWFHGWERFEEKFIETKHRVSHSSVASADSWVLTTR